MSYLRAHARLLYTVRAYASCIVSFEWDRLKSELNSRKHGVDFADAATVFEDLACITMDDDDPDETRFITIETDAIGRVLVVVYTGRIESESSQLAKQQLVNARPTRLQNEEGIRF